MTTSNGEFIRRWMSKDRDLGIFWQRHRMHSKSHSVREHFTQSRVDKAYFAGEGALARLYLQDKDVPDRGSATDAVADEVARVRLPSVDAAVAILKAQHLRCAACGTSMLFRRFQDDDPDRFTLARVMPSESAETRNVVGLCLVCNILDAGLVAMLNEVGPSWRDYPGNAMVEAPLPPTCTQPACFGVPDTDWDFDRVVAEREPAHSEHAFDAVR